MTNPVEQLAIERLNAIAAKLQERGNHYDEEYAHSEADDVLADTLKALGYDELVRVYNEIPKWYA